MKIAHTVYRTPGIVPEADGETKTNNAQKVFIGFNVILFITSRTMREDLS